MRKSNKGENLMCLQGLVCRTGVENDAGKVCWNQVLRSC